MTLRLIPALALTATLAACGANGMPQKPAPEPQSTGITVTGDARVGVTGTF